MYPSSLLTRAVLGIAGAVMMVSSSLYAANNCDISGMFSGKNATEAKTFLAADPDHYPPYQIFIHSQQIAPYMHSSYSEEQLEAISLATEDIRRLQLTVRPWGTFVKATTFTDPQTESETHYNAIWLRDSLWGYLALNSEKAHQKEAKDVLLTLWDYLSVPAQIERMANVIKEPSLLDGDTGQMQAVHIRFDSDSKDFSDVIDDGREQPWNHKQNDALGLSLDLIVRSIRSGQITRQDWSSGKRMTSLVSLVAYLDRARFDQMPDSGAWEEDARLNTSSIGLVTSGLEALHSLLSDTRSTTAVEFKEDFNRVAKHAGLAQYVSLTNLGELINRGYERITYQLTLGGESPDYRHNDQNYRTADAALLNLIYPARLSRLKLDQKKQILTIVRSLSGSYGIKRYLNDNYQSANFWFNDIRTDISEESNSRRRERFIPFTEAQWFFDSWFATASALVYQETLDPYFMTLAYQYMNRSLAQITGKGMLGANGREVPEMALPESYNFIATSDQLLPAPSPIIPLNWAKASLTLMIEHLRPITSSGHDTH